MAEQHVYTEEELTNPEVEPQPWADSVGKNGWSWCSECARWKPNGGPAHYGSWRCRSGGRPHCTCSACF